MNQKGTDGPGDELAALQRENQALRAQLAQIRGDDRVSRDEAAKHRFLLLGQELSALLHDLRNPLGIVIHSAEMLARPDAWGEGERTRIAQIIQRQGRSMEILVEDLLRFVRGETPLRLSQDSFDQMVDESCDLFRDALAEAGIRIQADLQCTEPLVFDREKMQRVLGNLLRNGLEALKGRKEATIRLHSRWDRSRGLEFTFEDNGPGIPPELSDSLFQPLRTAGKKRGHGLGLFGSQQIVVMHGGTMDWDRRFTGGARFVIRLPVLSDKVTED